MTNTTKMGVQSPLFIRAWHGSGWQLVLDMDLNIEVIVIRKVQKWQEKRF
jgi:hypothetical protein